MIKPVTFDEKLLFTLKLQMEKLTDEILADLMEERYTGVVEIWPVHTYTKGEVKLEVKFEKISSTALKKKNKLSLRYHVLPDKGVKLIV